MSEHMSVETHRTDATQLDEVQRGNQSWWTSNTMSYDWKDAVAPEKWSEAWYNEIDRRFIHDARLFGHSERPFDRLIPYDKLKDRRSLEIGCGMGFHTELITRAGSNHAAVDLSETSVEATRRRLSLRNLPADVRHADAEHLPFADGEFDFVWSWGVIHHSARTGRIVREIARVLKPDGSCRIMVYNRDGMSARIAFLRDHLLKGKMFRNSFDETLHHSTDGFSARHYVADQLEDLFRAFFGDVSSSICGQDADAVPLPRILRRQALKLVSDNWLRKRQARVGSFLFLEARNPLPATSSRQ